MGHIVVGMFVFVTFIYMSFVLSKNLDQLYGSDYLLNGFLYTILWLVSYLFYVNEPDTQRALYWYFITIFARTMTCTSLWIFAIKFTNPFYKFRREIVFSFFIIPILTGMFALTNNESHLLFDLITISKIVPEKVLSFEPGIWYYVDCFYNFCGLIIPILILVNHIKSVPIIFKVQYMIYILGYSIITLFFAVEIWGVFKTFDIGLLGIALGSYIIFWNLIHCNPSDFLIFAKDAVFQKISCVCLVVENNGTIMESNPEAQKLFAFLKKELKTFTYDSLKEALISEKKATFEVKNDGILFTLPLEDHLLFFQVFESPIYDSYKRQIGYFVEMRDITTQQELISELSNIVNYDALTGLYNRRYFEVMCEKLNDPSCMPLCVISGDLNKLKTTNDTYGHDVGDRLLYAIGQVLKQAGPKDAIVSRHGGDEFSVLLPRTNQMAALKYIERVHKLCAEYYEEPFGNLSISLGYAIKQRVEEDMKQVIIHADALMYRIKNEKRKEQIPDIRLPRETEGKNPRLEF